MVQQSILIIGTRNSGKTSTIRRVMESLERESRNLYKNKGKFVGLYLSSPQEQSAYCDYTTVIQMIGDKLADCEENDCVAIVLPFTLMRNSSGRVNLDCIFKPIEFLRTRCKKVSIIYLRKATARGIPELDALMKRIGAEFVDSNQNYHAQASAVTRFFESG